MGSRLTVLEVGPTPYDPLEALCEVPQPQGTTSRIAVRRADLVEFPCAKTYPEKDVEDEYCLIDDSRECLSTTASGTDSAADASESTSRNSSSQQGTADAVTLSPPHPLPQPSAPPSVAPHIFQKRLRTSNSMIRFRTIDKATVCIKKDHSVTGGHEVTGEALMSHVLTEQALRHHYRKGLGFVADTEGDRMAGGLNESGGMSEASRAMLRQLRRGNYSYQAPSRFGGVPFTPMLAHGGGDAPPSPSAAPQLTQPPSSGSPPDPSYALRGLASDEFAMAAVKFIPPGPTAISARPNLPSHLKETHALPMQGQNKSVVDGVMRRRLGLTGQQSSWGMVYGALDLLDKGKEMHGVTVLGWKGDSEVTRQLKSENVRAVAASAVGRRGLFVWGDDNGPNELISIHEVEFDTTPAPSASRNPPPPSTTHKRRVAVTSVTRIDPTGDMAGTFRHLPFKTDTSSPEQQFVRALGRLYTGGARPAPNTDPRAVEYLRRVDMGTILRQDLGFLGYSAATDNWPAALSAISFLSGRPLFHIGCGVPEWEMVVDVNALYRLHQAGGASTGGTFMSRALACLDYNKCMTPDRFIEKLARYFRVEPMPTKPPPPTAAHSCSPSPPPSAVPDIERLIGGRQDIIEPAKTILFQLVCLDPVERGVKEADAVRGQIVRLLQERTIVSRPLPGASEGSGDVDDTPYRIILPPSPADMPAVPPRTTTRPQPYDGGGWCCLMPLVLLMVGFLLLMVTSMLLVVEPVSSSVTPVGLPHACMPPHNGLGDCLPHTTWQL
ncbi:unnamed protein product [Vitrella brassicaformis CCMP3155]|uniref:Uncharacterized protein n=1 Tax=Vitrella brassicaformis (strain CCMP3155) TaxID=1169540 RepID=A0A0G4F3H7_VITBC|nr:unnamed protein product [Vitrella brassicaformis CCMP3155]|eukprot:CEM06472.1 unnamed protein product [Vitrella brassicaformis CCMP3155]